MTQHSDTYDEAGSEDTPPAPQESAERLALSPWAIASTCLGAAALFLGATIGILLAALAIITGHAARRDIKNGTKAGKSWATAGLGLGYLALFLAVLVIVLN